MTGSSVALFLVAKYVYLPLRNGDEEEIPLPFEWHFLEELEALPLRELNQDDLVKLGEREVDVETPEGRVLMTYDEDSNSFAYYTDNKNVSFKYLDAVARQFAVENDAKQICVNYGYDYVAQESKPVLSAERSSVFVKLKPRSSEPRRSKVTNRFSHRGTTDEKRTVLDASNSITFAEYKKKCIDST